MEMLNLEKELQSNSYPGRGIIIGRSADGTKAVTAYFIMGRSENSRNRVFVEDGEGIRTQAFDPSKLTDPSLIIYAPVRVLGNKTIVTNGDQTDTVYEGMDKQLTFEQSLRSRAIPLHMRIQQQERDILSIHTSVMVIHFQVLKGSQSLSAFRMIWKHLQILYGTV